MPSIERSLCSFTLIELCFLTLSSVRQCPFDARRSQWRRASCPKKTIPFSERFGAGTYRRRSIEGSHPVLSVLTLGRITALLTVRSLLFSRHILRRIIFEKYLSFVPLPRLLWKTEKPLPHKKFQDFSAECFREYKLRRVYGHNPKNNSNTRILLECIMVPKTSGHLPSNQMGRTISSRDVHTSNHTQRASPASDYILTKGGHDVLTANDDSAKL